MNTRKSGAEEAIRTPRNRQRGAVDWTRTLLQIALLPLLGMAACREPVPSIKPGSSAIEHPPAHATMREVAPARSSVRSVADGASPAVRDFKAFALNTLLLPLLDEEVPSRWADPSQSLACEDGRVTIDGGGLDIGAPVPREAFVVRWHLQRCETLDGYLELSGDVELRVEPRSGGFAAQVRAVGLELVSQYGADRLEESFDARLNVGP